MGQRLIITEEEKCRIRLLYETVPPNEYILIAKANPFKSSKFANARQLYNSELKNGDLFYELNLSLLRKDLQYDIIIKNLKNKTLRIQGDDKIVTITNANTSIFVENPLTNVGIGFSNEIKFKCDNSEKSAVYFDFYSDGKIKPNLYDCENPNQDLLNKIFSELKPFVISLIDEYNVEINKLLNDKKLIPDKYFEIRQIQRQKTDF